GEHWFEAGEWAAACAASADAANASIRLYAIHAAYAHVRRALDAHRLASGACTHTEVDEADLNRMAAAWAGSLGELDAALAYAAAFVDLVDPANSERAVEAHLLLTTAAWNVGDVEQAFAAIAAAEARLDDDAEGRAAAEVANTHARLLMMSGRAAESS